MIRIADRPVRLLEMGEGHTGVSFSSRSSAVGRPAAIRRAYRDLCRRAQLSPEYLSFLRREAADVLVTSGVLHDAFPSIELAFLRELHPNADWSHIARLFYESRSNVLGGLCASGHALGNSGLFQVAKAFHLD